MNDTLDRIEEVVAGATPGPWRQTGTQVHGGDYVSATIDRWVADATFIALARNTYPAAIAVVRAATAHSWAECRCGTLTHDDECALIVTENALRDALAAFDDVAKEAIR